MRLLTFLGVFILIPFFVEAKQSKSEVVLQMNCQDFSQLDEKELLDLEIQDSNFWYSDFATELFRKIEERHPKANVTQFKNEVLKHKPHPNHADDVNPLLYVFAVVFRECKSNETFQEALERIILKYKNNQN